MTGIGEDNHVPYSQLVGKQNSINPTEHGEYVFLRKKSMAEKKEQEWPTG